MIINLVILFFVYLIIYQFFYKIKEGLDTTDPDQTTSTTTQTYQDYDLNNPNNALILAQQNAGNIQVLKAQIDKLNSMSQTVTELSNNYTSLYDKVQGLIQQQADYANQLNGGSDEPVTVTGTDTTVT